MIIEPITFLNQTMATPTYYQGLRKMAKDYDIPFIVDETRTCMGKTGKMWAHEHWYLDDAPDIVTFGTSAHASGFFTTPDFRPLEPHKLTTVSNGSMEQIVSMKHVIKQIKRKNLLEKVTDCGTFIRVELDRINKKKRIYTNLRGYGTFLAFDCANFEQTMHLDQHFLNYGILTAMIGPTTIGIRPSLILEPMHAAYFRDAFEAYNPDYEF